MWGFSSCCKQRPISSCGAQASHWGGFSCYRAQALGMQASVVVARGLNWPVLVESLRKRDGTHVTCIGRQILNRWIARKVLAVASYMKET